MTARICEGCGLPIEGGRSDRRYHNDACRMRSVRAKVGASNTRARGWRHAVRVAPCSRVQAAQSVTHNQPHHLGAQAEHVSLTGQPSADNQPHPVGVQAEHLWLAGQPSADSQTHGVGDQTERVAPIGLPLADNQPHDVGDQSERVAPTGLPSADRQPHGVGKQAERMEATGRSSPDNQPHNESERAKREHSSSASAIGTARHTHALVGVDAPALERPSAEATRAADAVPAGDDLNAAALRLGAQLDAAAGEGLAQNTDRFLQFLGHQEGDVIELQALGVPGRYQPSNCFTHAATVPLAVAALEQMEESRAVGSYLLFNAVNPAVAARATANSWHVAQKGQCTTDRDVVARRAVYIDIDAERPSGISATDQELQCALRCAAQILAWLQAHLPAAALGVGHSGNGVSVFIALERTAEGPELSTRIKALLAGLDLRFSGSGAKVDRSVCDAKRLCPAFGTTKRKGAADVSERPHRTTGFWCAPSPQRLPPEALGALVEALRSELDDAGKATVDRELGLRPAAASPTAPLRPFAAPSAPDPSSPFSRANATSITDVITWLGLDAGEGRVRCPGCGESDQGVAIVGNGLKCHHARCAGKGVKQGFRSVVDLVMEVREVSNKEAVNLLAKQFGFEGMRAGHRTPRRQLHALAAETKGVSAPLPAAPPPADAPERPEDRLAGTDAAMLPSVLVGGRQLREVIDDCRAAILRANHTRVSQRGTLLHLSYDPPLAFRDARTAVYIRFGGDDAAPRIAEFNETVMVALLTRSADFVRLDFEGHCRPASPPRDVARHLVELPPLELSVLQAIVATPVFGQDGSLIIEPGYHRSESLWLHPDPKLKLPPVPMVPSADEIAAARSMLLEQLLPDFPFVGPADRAHALAALLLPFVRRLVRSNTPLHLVDAPAPGSGKGKLCNLLHIIYTGRELPTATIPENEDELRKKITSELRDGRPMILVDNVRDRKMVDSPALASALTTMAWSDRMLGKSEMIDAPNLAMWMMTGNNVKLSAELCRRTIRIRVDAHCEETWKRGGFLHDPILQWAMDHRSELVFAALVLVQAWIAAGKPLGQKRLGSFEHWAAVMDGLLTVIGVPGFLENLDQLHSDADAQGELWREFTSAWWERYRDEAVRIADLNTLCELRDLMGPARGDGNERAQQTRLGRALSGARDRIYGQLRIVSRHDRHRGRLYALEHKPRAPQPLPEPTTAITEVDEEEFDPWTCEAPPSASTLRATPR